MTRPAIAAALLFALAATARAAGDALPDRNGPPPAQGSAFRAFDDTLFTVAYDVFLAARNVKDAFELAREAVRQRPDLPPWRERLARTAEWAGDPALAQREWEYLGSRARNPEAFREAVRLAGALRDWPAAVRAWEGMAALRDLDKAEWGQFMDAYENAGEPARGIERLRRRLAAVPDPALHLRLVAMLQRTDRDEEALKTLESMGARYGNSAAIALRRANIHCGRGEIRQTAAILDAARGLPASDSDRVLLLRLQAAVYVWMQRYGDAMEAYRRLFESGRYDATDLRDLNGLARQRDPDLALRAAVAGWARFREADLLAYYLERCIEAERWDLASRALNRLSAEQWALFADMPYFYVLAARIHQREGKASLARREYGRALAQEPGSEDFQSGYLWLLVEQSRFSDLAAYVERWGRGPATPQSLLEPLAIANKLLQRHREALAYFRLLDREGEHADFPFLMNYAEILEQSGDGQGAARAYRRALEAMLAPPQPGEDREGREWREAMARWSWKFGSSEGTALRMAELNRRFRGGSGSKEAAFSWRVERGQNPEDAMAALGGAGKGEKAFPAWARLAVAMRAEDAGKVADLLEDKESGLGSEDKARAAAFLGLRREAAGYAAEGGLGPEGVPEPIGLHALAGLPGAGGGFEAWNHPLYAESRASLEGESPLGNGVSAKAVAEIKRRTRFGRDLTGPIPDREDAGRLELKRATAHATTRLAAGVRSTAKAVRSPHPVPAYAFSAEQEWSPMREAGLTAAYDRNAVADENPVLSMAALKERWRAGLRFALPADLEVDLLYARSVFRSWDGRRLGGGASASAQAEQRVFPGISAGVGLAFNGFAAGRTLPGPGGSPLIGGWLAPREFPQTFWRGSLMAELADRMRPGSDWIPTPIATVEVGRNYYPGSAFAAKGWSNDGGMRLGFSVKPTGSQRLTALAEYSRGLRLRNETESGISLRYACTFR